jgi:pyruvate/2-oxoglutarate/acetoin dehydrogenase E1 component
MFEDVFEELPWHLEEQATQAMRERRIKWPDWKEDDDDADRCAAPVPQHDRGDQRALDIMLARDPDVVIFGEDVGYFGGVFRATAGCRSKYGKNPGVRYPDQRMRDHRRGGGHGRLWPAPVPEIQFADYIYPGLDQLVSEAARLRYRSAGDFIAPITVRSPFGGGIFGGQTHSQSPEALFTHVAGLKTVIPSASRTTPRAC